MGAGPRRAPPERAAPGPPVVAKLRRSREDVAVSGEAILVQRVREAIRGNSPAPARPAALERVEAAAGHALPHLMRRIYTEVADGGWGPEYGALGFDRGHTDDLGGRVPEVYETWHSRDGLRDDDIILPRSWVPFLHAGCAMHYCTDCATPEGRVVLVDPNPGAPLNQCVVWQTESFASFVRLWLDDELDHQVWPSDDD